MVIPVYRRGRLVKTLMTIDEYPYAKSLAPAAYEDLKNYLDNEIEKHFRQRRYIARMMAEKEKAANAA